MGLFQEPIEELAPEILSEEKTLSVVDLIVNGGTGSIVIIGVLFVLLAVALLFILKDCLLLSSFQRLIKRLCIKLKIMSLMEN